MNVTVHLINGQQIVNHSTGADLAEVGATIRNGLAAGAAIVLHAPGEQIVPAGRRATDSGGPLPGPGTTNLVPARNVNFVVLQEDA